MGAWQFWNLRLGMRFNLGFACLIIPVLAGCSTLPNVGPGKDDVLSQQSVDDGTGLLEQRYEVVEITPAVISRLQQRTPNTFITSHTSEPSFPRDIVGVFVENYRRFHAGQALLHRVDLERGY